ncbi:phage tail terminator family protein [Clostridium fallax]|uniref:Phage protein n=1 Tax=Clostridium fallax TaxID=1533 RepID=A0A1M4UZV8_9CLOT|nr:hypothetical protein [Clostridium fallax]SHE62173.1 hypothetical protein SAMN05443638_10675 [Clostridium fallax]SQB06618.1 phage protein [Clostridium fallax]
MITNDLKIGINNTLDKEFPNINIYGEEIVQGFEEPCFFIKILDSEQNKELNKRYKRYISFDIHYFSDKEDINSDCLDMADKFYELLEYIEVNGDLYRTMNMKHEVVDSVLHFYLNFNFTVIKKDKAVDSVKMQKLTQEVVEKNG